MRRALSNQNAASTAQNSLINGQMDSEKDKARPQVSWSTRIILDDIQEHKSHNSRS